MSHAESMPIIRFEIEGMKYAILTAVTRYAAEMDSNINSAVESFCTEENLRMVISKHAHTAIDDAIKEEIYRFFRHGGGRAVIREAVESLLSKEHEP